jgi:hypothetical protein
MSITDAFRLLNQSIRESSRIEQDHERRMADIADRRTRLEYEMNDPQRLLAREKAAEQLEEVEVDLGTTWSSAGKSPTQISMWNNNIKPKMNEFANTLGAEIDDKGKLVYSGTDTPYKTAKWQSDEIMQQFNTVYAQLNTRSNQIDFELDELDSKIEMMEANTKESVRGKNRFVKDALDMARWKEKKDRLIEEKSDPKMSSKRFLSENMELLQQFKTMAGMTNPNQKWMTNTMKQVEANNAMLSMLAKSGKVDLKEHVYSLKEQNGTIHEIKVWGGANQPMQDFITGPRGIYTRGKINRAPAGSGGKTMSDPQKDTAYKDYKKWETEKAAIKEKMGDEQAIINQLGWTDSMDSEKRSIVSLIMQGDLPAAKKILEDKMVRYREKYGSGPKKVKGIPSQKEYIDRKLKGNSLELERE